MTHMRGSFLLLILGTGLSMRQGSEQPLNPVQPAKLATQATASPECIQYICRLCTSQVTSL